MNDYYTPVAEFTTVAEEQNRIPCPPHPALEAVAKMMEERRILQEKLKAYDFQIQELRSMIKAEAGNG